MQITYLGHSGFFMETEKADFLFDYCEGELPKINPGKPLLVFISHGHSDHYNPNVFELAKKHSAVQFILPKGTQIKKYVCIYEAQGIDLSQHLMLVKKNETYEIVLENGKPLQITTLKSTDIGVAYLLTFEGKTIYHAGDLNLWLWAEESQEFNDNMRRKYFAQLEKLRNREIDVAFVPLDVRQGTDAFAGIESFLEYTDSKHVFPMHMWGKYDIIRQLLARRPEYAPCIEKIEYSGQRFFL